MIEIKNRKASYDYFFLWSIVAGIQLQGSEVKQIKKGKATLVDAFCYFEKGELFLREMNVAPGKEAFMHEPLRVRKLLLKKNELKKLQKDLEEGITIIPKRIFCNERGFIKVEIALAKGKKNYDKRNTIKAREQERELRKVQN